MFNKYIMEETMIKVGVDLRDKLKVLVAKKRLKSYDELIRWLIKGKNGDLI